MSEPILLAEGLHKSYQMGAVRLRVLRGASLAVGRGEFLAVMGASGSGKSTLLHLLGALDVPDRGTVRFESTDVFAAGAGRRGALRNQAFGFVFQFYHLLPDLDVLENVLAPRMVRSAAGAWHADRREAIAAARELMQRLGLAERLGHRPNELSGGECQRVAIARALINSPAVLLADEPTGNLDAATGGQILKLLAGLNDAGQTIVMVTHDPDVAARAHRTVRLRDGRIDRRSA